MSVKSDLSGKSIEAGLSPAKVVFENRKVTYYDKRLNKTTHGHEIVREGFVHPDELDQVPEPVCNGEVVKEVRMTRKRRVKTDKNNFDDEPRW